VLDEHLRKEIRYGDRSELCDVIPRTLSDALVAYVEGKLSYIGLRWERVGVDS
jgi:hypothetical protein